MPIINNTYKEFEKAKSGTYRGVLAEVIDLGIVVDAQYGPKAKIMFIWVLDKTDSEGRPFTVAQRFNQSLYETSDMAKTVKRITGSLPVAPFNTDVLIGKSKMLVVTTELNAKQKMVSYVEMILPLGEGQEPLTVPANYVYTKDRKKSTFAGNPNAGTQAQQAARPAAAPAAAQQAVGTEVADEDIPF